MSALLKPFLPYIIGIPILFAAGWTLHHKGYAAGYTASEAKGWEQKAKGEEAARKAVEGQLADAQATVKRNSQVLDVLHTQNAAITADRDHTRDLVRRMLAAATRPSTPGHPVPEAGSGPRTPEAGGTGGNERLEGLLVAASEECTRNANRLDSLIAEIKPQL